MKSATTRAIVALSIGAVLTLAAFLGTFFWAGVPDNGVLTLPEKTDSVRYQGPVSPKVDPGYLQNFVGFQVEIAAQGENVSGTLTSTEPGAKEGEAVATVETDRGPVTVRVGEGDEITAHGYAYGKPDWGQKIFYFHVPAAEISFLVFGVAAYFSIRFITTRKREWDTKSRIAMELTMLFVSITMATGILWTRAAWNVWWRWEPRLTTYFIMTLLVIAYFVLRNAVEDEERRALYAAAFSILGFIDAPISFFITRFMESTHPVIERGGLEPPMLVTFIVSQVGMLLVGYAIYRMRMGEVELRDRIEAAKTLLEG